MRSSSAADGKNTRTIIGEKGSCGNHGSNCTGFLQVIGIGPGSLMELTPRAKDAIERADVVVGYDVYLQLIQPLLENKNIKSSGMMQEIDRCQAAVDDAAKGHHVVVISSGDPGVYGMAGLVLELTMKLPEEQRPKVEIIPGISAVSAAAAILGAPLMHDFAVISLSDLLTPWEVIEKRVRLAAEGDFVIALYNPKSTKRVEHIEKVRKVVLESRAGQTPVGIVHHASRENEAMKISDLASFTEEHIDMFSLVIIGNSHTYVKANRMITPRGYVL